MRFMEFSGLSVSVLTSLEFSSIEEGTFERPWAVEFEDLGEGQMEMALRRHAQSATAVGCLGCRRGSVVVCS